MKKLLLMSLMAMLGLTTVNAQKTVVAQKNQQVFDVVEQMPEYPGGMQALLEYLMENVKYPEDAEKQKIEGRVIAIFVVETDGSISNVEVVRPVFPSLDAEHQTAEFAWRERCVYRRARQSGEIEGIYVAVWFVARGNRFHG